MTVYKKKNGKWYCQFMVKGERIHKLLDGATDIQTAKELEDAERFKTRQVQNGLIEKTPHITLEKMMQRYVKVSEINNKSVNEAKTFKKGWIKYFASNKDILEIKPHHLDGFKLHMIESGRSKATTNRYLSALRRAYNILISDGVINYNPVTKVKMFVEDNHRYRYLTKEEWERLKQYLNPVTLNIVKVALYTGLRKGNVLNLKWEQIDFDLRTIELLKSENKGKKEIRIPISDDLYNLLQTLEPKQRGYVFVNPETNKPYTDIKKSFKLALKKAGIIDFKFHDLRRTVGTWLLTSGVDLRTVQNILAHSDISTTQRYLCLTSEQNKKAMSVLNSYV